MNACKRAALLMIAIFACFALPVASQKRLITEKDLLKFKWIADPQISPDGKQAAYVLVEVNEKDDRYDTSIWLIETTAGSAPRRLTAGPRDAGPRWSPDARTLAFTRSAADSPQIYLLPYAAGGEARKLTDLPRGASAATWSPDGKTIAFTSTTKQEDIEKKKKAEKGEKEEKKSDVLIVTRAVYRFNNQGFLLPDRPAHIWTVPSDLNRMEPAEAKQITSGKYSENIAGWSSDGTRIYFTSNRIDEAYYEDPDSNLYSVPAIGGASTTIIDIDGPVGGPEPAPDGKRWAFAGFLNPPQPRSSQQADVFVFDGKPRNLTQDYDFDIGAGVISDQAPPRGGGQDDILWTPDGRSLLLTTTEHGASNLVRMDAASGRIESLTDSKHDVLAWTATPDRARIALTISTPTSVGELFLLDTATKKNTQLTKVNDELFSQLKLSEPEEFWYSSFDGKKIHGWILKPPDFDASKKYPLILEIHGGPHTEYGEAFFHEFQWMAAKGYVVLYTNPRGSTSYGQEFANLIQHRYPGDDYKDLMIGVDELLKRGYVDEKRMGVTGGSGGGLLTNWTVTQTGRFAAAVSQRSVADWLSFWYTADFTLFRPTWFRKFPFQDPEEYLNRSPVRFVEKVTTPLMFIHSEEDWRTPPGQGAEPMFRALKALKKTTVMVRFPGESHDLSRSGKPSHRVERLQHILNWFDIYLQGKRIDSYDLR
ncbi:MAG: S9 family peptidase [Candidatus Acidiferrales bacterium]